MSREERILKIVKKLRGGRIVKERKMDERMEV